MLKLLPLLLLLGLVACSPVSLPQSDQPAPPESYLGASQQADASLPERWWRGFADPQLDQLQQLLLADNLDLRQGLHRLQQLEALQRASGASLWPALGLSGSLSRESSPGLSGTTLGTNSRISLAAGYEVDLWRKLHDRTAAAELRYQASGQELQTLLLSLSAQLADQYYLAAEQRLQLQLSRQQIAIAQQLLDAQQERYRSGLASGSDLYQARQSLALARARLPQQRATLTRAENGIALLLGRLPQPELLQPAALPELTSLIDAGLPASLLTRRPDIAASLLQLEAADRELAAALAERLPAIDLSASLGRSSSTLAFGDLSGSFWSLALGLTQPLFDGGRRRAEVDRQQALRDERLAAYRQTILQAVQEVENGLAADRGSSERLRWLRQQQQASDDDLQLARDNYRGGLAGYLPLLNAEVRQLEVAGQRLAAQRQWLSDRIGLARSLGGGWMQQQLSQQLQTLNEKREQP